MAEREQRPLQGEHSNHHPASAVPDRDVKTATSNVPKGTNPISKANLATGEAQPPTKRDTDEPNLSKQG